MNDASIQPKTWGRRMSDQIIFTREDSDRLVRLEQQTIQQTEMLAQVLTQTTKTNGRVNVAEDRLTMLETDKAKQQGAKWILNILWVGIATITGLIIAAITKG